MVWRGSSGTISNNTITWNTGGAGVTCASSTACNAAAGGPGGICVRELGDGGGVAGHGLISGNTIANNTANHDGALWSSGTISGNTVNDNASYHDGGGVCGGGTISGNTIAGNTAGYRSSSNAIGGVAAPSASTAVVLSGSGGGVYGGGTVIGNLILNNSTIGDSSSTRDPAGGGGIGGGGLISGNVIAGNSSEWHGGGICYNRRHCGGPMAAITNNTIVGNNSSYAYAVYFGGLLPWCTGGLPVVMSNNIVAFNTGGVDVYSQDILPYVLLRNNDVYGNAAADCGYSLCEPLGMNGNICADPLFVNQAGGDYHLRGSSPCINAGWNDAPGLSLFDMDREGRIFNWTVDIGADEYWSPEMSTADAKAAPDGAHLSGTGSVVTAAFEKSFYLEADDRSSGIRVEKAAHGLAVWDRADVSGTVSTNADGEKCILATSVLKDGSGTVGPLSLNNRLVGGGEWRYDTSTGAGQKGISGSGEMNNIGLLVRIWGRVTLSGRGWFYVDDGAGVQDGSGVVGIYVEAPGLVAPPKGTFVFVTGISSCEYYQGKLVNVLLPRWQDDIVVAPTAIAAASSDSRPGAVRAPDTAAACACRSMAQPRGLPIITARKHLRLVLEHCDR